MKVVGIERKTGTFEGKSYDNTYVHTTYALDEKKGGEGFGVAKTKIKTCDLPFKINIGDDVKFFYDRFGNAIGVDLE